MSRGRDRTCREVEMMRPMEAAREAAVQAGRQPVVGAEAPLAVVGNDPQPPPLMVSVHDYRAPRLTHL